MPITSRSTPGESGPRSTRSPTNTAAGRRVRRVDRAAGVVARELVAEPAQQRLQLGPAAVHVADDVERAGQVPAVVEQLLADDLGGVDLLDGRSTCTLRKPSRARPRSDRRSCSRCRRTTCGTEVAVGRPGLRSMHSSLGHVEHDRHRQHVVLPGQLDQRCAGRRGCTLVASTTVSRPAAQPLAGDVVQHVERVARWPPGRSRRRRPGRGRSRWRSPRCGRKCSPGERRLARAGDADQHHQGQLGNGSRLIAAVPLESRRGVNTASWVGGPTSGSSSPTGVNVDV